MGLYNVCMYIGKRLDQVTTSDLYAEYGLDANTQAFTGMLSHHIKSMYNIFHHHYHCHPRQVMRWRCTETTTISKSPRRPPRRPSSSTPFPWRDTGRAHTYIRCMDWEVRILLEPESETPAYWFSVYHTCVYLCKCMYVKSISNAMESEQLWRKWSRKVFLK